MSEVTAFTDDELKILFPDRKVDLGKGIMVTVTPIPLPHVSKILDAFSSLMYRVQAGVSPAVLATESIKDVMALLPYCIDRDIEKIPSAAAPELIEALIEVNFTEDLVSKWQALAENMTKMAQIGQG